MGVVALGVDTENGEVPWTPTEGVVARSEGPTELAMVSIWVAAVTVMDAEVSVGGGGAEAVGSVSLKLEKFVRASG